MRAIIIEDESLIAKELQHKIASVAPDVTITEILPSVKTARKWFMENAEPDLVFADIQLSDGVSFEVFERYELKCPIIFTTAYDEYAIRAFKVNGVDYLLKPIDIDELQKAVEKAKVKRDHDLQRRKLETLMSNLGTANKKKICLSTNEGMEFINVQDIVFCEANGAYTKFTLANTTTILVSKNLKEYETILSDQNFMRVHNSFLINLAEVKKFVKSDGGYILMKNNSQISISPKKRDEFLERMTERF